MIKNGQGFTFVAYLDKMCRSTTDSWRTLSPNNWNTGLSLMEKGGKNMEKMKGYCHEPMVFNICKYCIKTNADVKVCVCIYMHSVHTLISRNHAPLKRTCAF